MPNDFQSSADKINRSITVEVDMNRIEANTTNSLLEAWQTQQDTQLALASAIMKQQMDIMETSNEAIVKLIDDSPRIDGSGQLIQKSA